MASFSDVVQAQTEGREVHLAALVEFDFPDAKSYVWDGVGILDVDGHEWIGSGELGSISEITFGENDSADSVTFQLSGVSPEVVALARQNDSVRGRDVTLYGLFFDEDSQPLDQKFIFRQFIMDTIGYGAQGPSRRSISLTAETIWTNRNASAFAYWSDRDQKARYPGDRGLEFISRYTSNTRRAWPTF